MKNLKKILFATIVSIFVMSCATTQQFKDIDQFQHIPISPQKAFTLSLHSLDTITIIDLRTPSEFALKHINGAQNIDFMSIEFMGLLDELDRDRTYMIYSRNNNMSLKAINVMREMGFKRIHHIEGGFIAWESAGLPASR